MPSRRPLVRNLAIGVDLDGVLADQITSVLPHIQLKYGVTLTYEQVTDWRLRIGSSDIAKEIVESLRDREYIMRMAPRPGARMMLDRLVTCFRVVILTARDEDALAWSAEWLSQRKLPFDEIVGSVEARKSRHGVNALVDDFLGNISEFLDNTRGPAVLVDQPWNRMGRDALSRFREVSRLVVVSHLTDVPPALEERLLPERHG